MRAEPVLDSTRGPALPYPAGMRSTTILIPLLMILANDVRCKDDEPAGGEFGEACGGEIKAPCQDGLKCLIGYCEEECMDDSDCQPVEGNQRECHDALCRIVCDDAAMPCPQTLATPLECNLGWCNAIGGL